MEIENKYYTPQDKEFQIGFEYEYSYRQTSWCNHTINTKADLTLCIEENEENLIRVKYLSQKDIESFGFVYNGKTIDNWYTLIVNHTRVMSNYVNRSISLQHDFRTNQGVIIKGYEFEDKSGEEEILYRGSCKNKSEFKKLLIQLNIIQDEK
jgi:hypothetical protein